MEKQNPFGEKNTQGPQKAPKNKTKKLPVGPGERSDEESIGRPVQLDKDQPKRQPGEGQQEGRPRSEPAGA